MRQQFRKKPVVIEAEQFTRDMIDGFYYGEAPLPRGVLWEPAHFYVVTIHGQKTNIVAGDWILPEPDGEHFYPCKPDIFAATYEPVEAQ